MKKFIIFSLLGMMLFCNQALATSLIGTPVATTQATGVGLSTATLNGVLGTIKNMNWVGTVIGPVYYFEYGTSPSYGTQINALPIVYGESFAPIENPGYYVSLTNLMPNTTYYYRFVVKTGDVNNQNNWTYYYGDIVSFRTASGDTCDNPDFGLSTLRRGSGSLYVSNLQHALNVILHITLSTDGKFGPLTEIAVIEFQNQHNLGGDGKVGPLTRGMLHSVLSSLSCPNIPVQ